MGTKKLLLNALMLAAYMSDLGNSAYVVRKRTSLVQDHVKPTKLSHKELRVYIIKGVEIEAYSKKDALKRYNHKYKK